VLMVLAHQPQSNKPRSASEVKNVFMFGDLFRAVFVNQKFAHGAVLLKAEPGVRTAASLFPEAME
jgi:hypothetical protein